MRRFGCLILCVLLWFGGAHAQSIPFPGPGMPASAAGGSPMVTPMLGGSGPTGTGPSNSVTNSTAFYASNANSAWAAGSLRGLPIAVPGTISNLVVRFPSMATGSYVMTVNKASAGGAPANTALTCTITSTTPCQDNTHSFSVIAGDIITLESAPSGTPTANTTVQWSALFTSANNGESFLVFPFSGSASTSAVNFMGLNALVGTNATEVNVSSVMPTAGAVDHIYVNATAAPGAAKSYAIALCKNGTCTSTPTCTLSGAAQISCNDTSTGAVSYAAGDTISIQITPSGTPTSSSIQASVRWVPTTPGEAIFTMTGSLGAGAGTGYGNLNGSGSSIGAEANAPNLAITTNFTIKNMQVSVNTAVGGTSRVFNMRAGGATVGSPGNLSCIMTALQSSCSDPINTYSTSAVATLLNWQMVATGAVNANTWAKITAVATVP